MKRHPASSENNHCAVLEQKHLVSEMTECDKAKENFDQKYECYLKATEESRESKACLYS